MREKMKTCPVCSYSNPDNAQTCNNPDCGYTFDSSPGWERTAPPFTDINSFSAGDRIADRYDVVRKLGQGGMGVVFLVRDNELRNMEVALKMIIPELLANAEARRRFEDEVIISQRLGRGNIVRVYDLKRWGDLRFFTMEYVPGRTLREWQTERKNHRPPFSLPEAVKIIDALLDALTYAHRSTIHRDIKPENVMIVGEFPKVRIKVLDFGIAKAMSAEHFSKTSMMLGTAGYMAPEQMAGGKKMDHRADLYSVGMVLYKMLTGEMAMGRFPLPSQLNPELPPAIDRVVEKVLDWKPDGRFAHATEMRQALAGGLCGSLVASAGKSTSRPWLRGLSVGSGLPT